MGGGTLASTPQVSQSGVMPPLLLFVFALARVGDEASADADGELAADPSVDEVAHRHSDLAERVGAFHRGRQIAGLDQAGEHDQISSVLRAEKRAELMMHERGQDRGSYLRSAP